MCETDDILTFTGFIFGDLRGLWRVTFLIQM
jgi:hypothetical protein